MTHDTHDVHDHEHTQGHEHDHEHTQGHEHARERERVHEHHPEQHEHGHEHTASSEADGARRQLEAFRKQKDKFFHENPESPIQHEDKTHFRGLNYYPVDLKYRVVAMLVPDSNPGIFRVQTTTGGFKEYTRVGRLEFEVDGQPLRLTAFMPPADEPLHGNRLFVPFRDATSGKETYGAGRYIDLNKKASNEYILDFNRAYNPYCAYSPYYSCPLPPGENTLQIALRAGEKSFHEEEH